MTALIQLNNLNINSINWDMIGGVHIYHPVFGQLEGVGACGVCGNRANLWSCMHTTQNMSFNMLESNDTVNGWSKEEFLTLAMMVIESTPEPERRYITFHFLPRPVEHLGGFDAVPYMTPPLVDEELRLLNFFSWLLVESDKHKATHDLIEAPTHARPN